MNRELVAFIDDFLRQSVVLLCDDSKPKATGFFVSNVGDICSCAHHGLVPNTGELTVKWGSAVLPAKQTCSDLEHDFAMFKIRPDALGDRATPALPLLDRPLTVSDAFDWVVTFGYAGLDSDWDIDASLYDGRLVKVGDSEHSVVANRSRRIESLDVVPGRGISGAPLFDLRLFRVVGYVQGRPHQVQRVGGALDLSPLFRRRPDLATLWSDVCRRADTTKLSFFHRQRVPIPRDLLTWTDVAEKLSAANRDAISSLEDANVYDERLFVARDIGRQLRTFLEESDAPVAILSGASGSGKTNLLADMACSGTDADEVYILVPCQGLTEPDPLDAVPRLIGTNATLEAILGCARDAETRRLVIMLDAFNEWDGASRSALTRILQRAKDAQVDRPCHLKVIISIRTEFLHERIPELTHMAKAGAHLDLGDILEEALYIHTDYDRRQRRQISRPVIEVPNLTDTPLDTEESEQRRMYEQYRAIGSMRTPKGQTIGIRPTTTYEELPPSVRRILDRPIILKLFMRRYHEQDVPDTGVRSVLLRDIVSPDIDRFSPSLLTRESVQVFLTHFAAHLFRLGQLDCPVRRLACESWYDREIVELLLANSLFLVKTRIRDSLIGGTRLGFSSEWLFEYYFSLFIWEEVTLASAPERVAVVEALLGDVPNERSAERLVGALTFFGESVLTLDTTLLPVVLRVCSAEGKVHTNNAFVCTFLEFVRANYGFGRPIPGNVASDESFVKLIATAAGVFTSAGLGRILDYVEKLVDQALPDAIELLTSPVAFWATLDADGKLDHSTLLALKRFQLNDIDGAYAEAQSMAPDSMPAHIHARWAFVIGRCLQYRQQYADAIQVYERCVDVPDRYAAMCRHQLAFIRFLQHSDYRGAADLLGVTDSPSGRRWATAASELLYATCMTELGDYLTARPILRRYATSLRRQGRKREAGKALRVLGDLYARRFEAGLAEEVLDRAATLTKDSPQSLTYAGILETRAMVLGLLRGQMAEAEALLEEAMLLAEQAQHRPNISWFLQSRALLRSLKGDAEGIEPDLERALSLGCNPNQARRTQLIRLIANCSQSSECRSCEGLSQAEALAAAYRTAGNGWYPGILSLLAAALRNELPQTAASAAACFEESVDGEGILASYLYRHLGLL